MSEIAQGRVFSELTRERLRLASIGKKYSLETLAKMSAKIGKKISDETITKIKAYQSTRVKHPVPGTKVSVTDTITHETTIYESVRRAAAALDTNHNTIRNYLKNNKLYKDRYSLLTFKNTSN